MTTDTNIPQLVFNKMSNAKYEELKTAGQLVDTEFYVTPDNSQTLPTVDTTTTDKVLSNDGTNMLWTNIEFPEPELGYKQLTNCITKIPQDIKLEIADGVLTLKAGSKVYIPNGFEADGVTKKFDTFIIDNDYTKTTTTTASGKTLLFFKRNIDGNHTLSLVTVSDDATKWSYSGTTAPTEFVNGIAYWYDTQNNIVKNTVNSGAEWLEDFSLPIAIIGYTPNTFISIDQIFNGFGYIGSTEFVLPGVTGQYSIGLNNNGVYNIQEYIVPSVMIETLNSDVYGIYWVGIDTSGYFGAYANRPIISTNKPNIHNIAWFNPNTGILSYIDNTGEITGTGYGEFIYAIITVSSGKIIDWKQIGTTVTLVNMNDSSWIAEQAMPSDKYIDLTLGASGTTYTAPANGWVSISSATSSSNCYVTLLSQNENDDTLLYSVSTGHSASTHSVGTYIPIIKGQTFAIYYDLSGASSTIFRFIYAQGEV